MTTTFENAKVGDRVYSILHGSGVILETLASEDEYGSILVKFDIDGKQG